MIADVVPTDRRHDPRAVRYFRAPVCPECLGALSDNHYRDTGPLTERPEGACPAMFERRKAPR